MNPLGLLFVFVSQDPAAGTTTLPRTLDVVELKNGDTLQGRILTEIDGFLEIELEAGASVGFSTAQVAAIRRGAGTAPSASATVAPRNEWFVLHDATGAAVGWLSASVAHRGDGGFAVNEEYEFCAGQRRYQVTSLAIADRAGVPVSCYFRERISEPVLAALRLPVADAGGQQDRVVDERIVEASVRGEQLFVQRLDRTGRKERTLGWPAGASFPLLARTLARAHGTTVASATLFDPVSEEMGLRSYAGGRHRSVVLDGKPVQVTEVAETTATGRNSEWVDASSRTLRRELAGPALVAVPSSADSARRAVGATTIPGAVVAEAGGRFGLWVPNPAWTPREAMPAGQVALSCAAHGATVSLSRLDHLEPTTPLDAAADAVTNWFQLLQPELTITSRQAGTVRERPTVQLEAAGQRAGVATRAVVDVIPHQDHHLVFVCVAPAKAWDELASDFEFLRRTVELTPQALAPTLQGPLAQRPTNGKRSFAGPQDRVPPPPVRTAAASAVPAPVVRIPND